MEFIDKASLTSANLLFFLVLWHHQHCYRNEFFVSISLFMHRLYLCVFTAVNLIGTQRLKVDPGSNSKEALHMFSSKLQKVSRKYFLLVAYLSMSSYH